LSTDGWGELKHSTVCGDLNVPRGRAGMARWQCGKMGTPVSVRAVI